MKLVKILMDKKRENEKLYLKYGDYAAAFEEHFSRYLHAIAYLKIIDVQFKDKLKVYIKFISTTGKAQVKNYNKLLKFRQHEDSIIFEAYEMIEEKKNTGANIGFSTLWRPFTIGIDSYEMNIE